jgi:hypothetical protein
VSVDSREILLLPFELVERARMAHGLIYRNPWPYKHDYTLANIMAIPQFIGEWCDCGSIDLSSDAMELFWDKHADKRAREKDGEILRVSKLALDALAELYQACGFCQYARVPAKYNGLYDSNGIDLRLLVDGEWASVNVYRNVNECSNHLAVKAKRRAKRGCGNAEVIELCAYKDDLDISRQPWVPVPDWFSAQVSAIKSLSVEVA